MGKIDGRQPRRGAPRLLTAPRRRDRAWCAAAHDSAAPSAEILLTSMRIKAVFGLDAGVFLPMLTPPCGPAKVGARVGKPRADGGPRGVGQAHGNASTCSPAPASLVRRRRRRRRPSGSRPAEAVGVALDIAPRFSHDDLAHRMATARASSLRPRRALRAEPVEAHAVGTPALMVNAGASVPRSPTACPALLRANCAACLPLSKRPTRAPERPGGGGA